MNLIHLSSAAALIALVTCAAGPVDGFVIGKTTVANVQQVLGAPMDTSMRPDGALTLDYRTPRLAKAETAGAGTQTISLRFGTDFVLRDATVAAAADQMADNGLASK